MNASNWVFDDVMKWKYFRVTGPLWGESNGDKGPAMLKMFPCHSQIENFYTALCPSIQTCTHIIHFTHSKCQKISLSSSILKDVVKSMRTSWPQKLRNNHARFTLRYCVYHSVVGYMDGLVQNCSISIVNALLILQTCTKPSICRNSDGQVPNPYISS